MDRLAQIIDNPEALATVLSIGIGLVVGVFGFIWNNRQDRKRYTYDVLMRYTENDRVLTALEHVWTHIANNDRYDESAVEPQLEKSLFVLLAYFQSLAIAANSKMLDEKILMKARYGQMQAVWDYFLPYVAQRRRRLNRPLMYGDLEEFVGAHRRKYQTYEEIQKPRLI